MSSSSVQYLQVFSDLINDEDLMGYFFSYYYHFIIYENKCDASRVRIKIYIFFK